MLTAFDVGFGVLVLISAILATARGLTREVLSLVTWAGSAGIAIFMWQKHPEIARGFIKEQIVADVATVGVSFIVSLIILHIITMRIADFVVDSKIGPLDRTLGFVFGVLRGVLIAVVVVVFGLWLYLNQLPGQSQTPDFSKLPDWAAQSKTLPILDNFGHELIALLPSDLEEQLNKLMKHGGAAAPAADDSSAPAGDDTTTPNDSTPSPDATTPPATTPPATTTTPAAKPANT
jgi:membrane protein required for colicin V production